MDFYDAIAPDYDAMTSGGDRPQRVAHWAETFIRRYRPRRVLDVACGSGWHAAALAQRGAEVVAADISAAMLEQARAYAQSVGAAVTFEQAAMQQAAEHVSGPFDLILCLGNSLPHLLTKRDFQAALVGWRRLLAPEGVLLIHLLNYERILRTRQRIVGITVAGPLEFVRFYDFEPPLVRFNLLRIDHGQTPPGHRLTETMLYPYTHSQLAGALPVVGFGPPQLYGDINFNPVQADSQAVIVEARPG